MQAQLTHIDEAAKALNISTSTLYRLARENKIPHLRVGKRYLFQVDKIIELMIQNQRKAEPTLRRERPAVALPGLTPPSMDSLTKRIAEAAAALTLVAKQIEAMRATQPSETAASRSGPVPSWT